jgi:predicted nucleotidyltransferase
MASSLQNKIIKLVLSTIPSVKLIYLFGSQASNTQTSESDIDIAVLTDKKLDPIERWDIAANLANQFNSAVDLVDLLSASTVMQHEIIHNSICLYDAGNNENRFAMQVMSMYQHLNEERAEILSQFMKPDEDQ